MENDSNTYNDDDLVDDIVVGDDDAHDCMIMRTFIMMRMAKTP